MSTTVKNSKVARRYGEDFKRQAVELMIHSGKTQRQVARELDVSEYSLNLWKKAYLGQMKPAGRESEGPIVVTNSGNAEGAKGP
jgi:transposase-like protein